MKILVSIINYGEEQLNYLDRVVSEYRSLRLRSNRPYEVDIVIHTNPGIKHFVNNDLYKDVIFKEYSIGDKIALSTGKTWEFTNYQQLPWTARPVLYSARNDYDFFIFTENDHLITYKHIEDYLKVTEILPDNRIAGHLQYEQYEEGKFYPAYHAHYKWDYNSVEKHGDYVFAHFTNVHQAFYMLTKEQHDRVIKNLPDYETDNITGVPYSIKPRANTDIFTHGGMKKLIPISHIDDFLVYHMPNVYHKQGSGRHFGQGAWDKLMDSDIQRLLEISKEL